MLLRHTHLLCHIDKFDKLTLTMTLTSEHIMHTDVPSITRSKD